MSNVVLVSKSSLKVLSETVEAQTGIIAEIIDLLEAPPKDLEANIVDIATKLTISSRNINVFYKALAGRS